MDKIKHFSLKVKRCFFNAAYFRHSERKNEENSENGGAFAKKRYPPA